MIYDVSLYTIPLSFLLAHLTLHPIFNSILYVVSKKKIFEISANQRLLWPLAAILDNRS
jgi:hypothetical protein